MVPAGTDPVGVSDRTLGHSSGTRQPVDRSDRSSGCTRASVGEHSTQDEAVRSARRRARIRPGSRWGSAPKEIRVLEISKSPGASDRFILGGALADLGLV